MGSCLKGGSRKLVKTKAHIVKVVDLAVLLMCLLVEDNYSNSQEGGPNDPSTRKWISLGREAR